MRSVELKNNCVECRFSVCVHDVVWSVCSFSLCEDRWDHFISFSSSSSSSCENSEICIYVFFSGHFVAPFAAHSFCNHMGFPDLSEIAAYKDPLKRAGLMCLFVIGLVAWCFLLMPMTHPSLFNNDLFWTKYFETRPISNKY